MTGLDHAPSSIRGHGGHEDDDGGDDRRVDDGDDRRVDDFDVGGTLDHVPGHARKSITMQD